ncbi:hypothetical protein [Streptomyces leeuwenhoekii]|uniref:Membrane Lipoprotein n=2 Tax=Streptomyces leeuwenhoekii TaxID=1437453 RepID=A0A0F7VTZ4_STRLW|nr:hypothetical protein [Streptomyces leeuwenhoekii]CQR61027.1 Membrane Lipoprotein [Streptomyces leeuwenhoekii]
MMRSPRLLPSLLLPALVLLAACGTERPGSGPAAGQPGGSAGPAASASPAGRGELDARARALGVAPELVYVTEASGYALARQSVGVLGDDGFSAIYVARATGAQLRLSAERGSIDAGTCPERPVGDLAGEPAVCARDGGLWYRTGAGWHEYALPEDGHVVRVSGEADAVPREVLRAAARAVHRPDAAETAALLPPADPAATAPPVERGDLPSVGDGAPRNDVRAGG